jgi:hypothetical protein
MRRSSPMHRMTQGMLVSISVGSVSAEFIMGISIFSATRIAMCELAPSIVPRTAHTLSR